MTVFLCKHSTWSWYLFGTKMNSTNNGIPKQGCVKCWASAMNIIRHTWTESVLKFQASVNNQVAEKNAKEICYGQTAGDIRVKKYTAFSFWARV